MIGDNNTNPSPAAMLLAFLALTALTALPSATACFEGKLSATAGGGYQGLFSTRADTPATLNGGGVIGRLELGFDQTWGLAVTGGMSWFQPFDTTILVEEEGEDGEAVQSTAPGPSHRSIRTQDLALTLIYVIDVMKVSPYLGAGVGSIRTMEDVGGARVDDYDLSLRFDLGVDFRLTDHFQLGALITFDTYLSQRSSYISRTGLWLVLGFYKDFHKTGRLE